MWPPAHKMEFIRGMNAWTCTSEQCSEAAVKVLCNTKIGNKIIKEKDSIDLQRAPFAGVVDTYPNSGAAVKCEGLDLPILQEHLQHIWDEQQRVVLEHCLEKIPNGKQSSFSAASVLHYGDKTGHGCILYIEINEPRPVSRMSEWCISQCCYTKMCCRVDAGYCFYSEEKGKCLLCHSCLELLDNEDLCFSSWLWQWYSGNYMSRVIMWETEACWSEHSPSVCPKTK